MTEWVDAKVTGKITWTNALFSLHFEASVDVFEAGQFVTAAIYKNGTYISRAYSYVNPPDKTPLEIYVVLIAAGQLSPLLADLRVGDGFQVSRKANGFFTLSEVPDADSLWMMATGTGIGPYLSILGSTDVWLRFKTIVLVHGIRTADELACRDRIEMLQKMFPEKLIYVPVLSRDQQAGLLYGRIPDLIDSGALERISGLTLQPENTQVMLCGNPQMISDVTSKLCGRGFKRNRRRDPGNITVEGYWR